MVVIEPMFDLDVSGQTLAGTEGFSLSDDDGNYRLDIPGQEA